MPWPPTLPPTGRTNATVEWDNHPGDHNVTAQALTDIVNQVTANMAAIAALQGIAPGIAPGAGLWVPGWGAYTGNSGVNVTTQQMRGLRTYFGRPIDRVAIRPATIGGTPTAHVGAYTDVNGSPGSLIGTTGPLSLVSNTTVEGALSIPAGVCWLAFVLNAPSDQAFNIGVAYWPSPWMTGQPASDPMNQTVIFWAVNGQTSLPNPWPAGSTVKTVQGVMPQIMVRGA